MKSPTLDLRSGHDVGVLRSTLVRLYSAWSLLKILSCSLYSSPMRGFWGRGGEEKKKRWRLKDLSKGHVVGGSAALHRRVWGGHTTEAGAGSRCQTPRFAAERVRGARRWPSTGFKCIISRALTDGHWKARGGVRGIQHVAFPRLVSP